MRRIKVVSEPTDLVPILRAFDADLKRSVFNKLAEGWCTAGQIKEEFGEPGLEALALFEKTKLVETRWQAEEGKTLKAYRAYYTSFQINVSSSALDIAEILQVATMPDEDFHKLEAEIVAMVGREGFSSRAITEKIGVPLIRLRSILKRSSKLELKGHLVRRLE